MCMCAAGYLLHGWQRRYDVSDRNQVCAAFVLKIMYAYAQNTPWPSLRAQKTRFRKESDLCGDWAWPTHWPFRHATGSGRVLAEPATDSHSTSITCASTAPCVVGGFVVESQIILRLRLLTWHYTRSFKGSQTHTCLLCSSSLVVCGNASLFLFYCPFRSPGCAITIG